MTDRHASRKLSAQAENLIRTGSPGDGYTLIVLAGGVQAIVPGPSNDPENGRCRITKVKPTHGPADTARRSPPSPT